MNLCNFEKECCGCGVCANVCPLSAIVMEEDEKGFRYPKIDDKICKNCGLCIDICNFKKNQKREDKIVVAYAMQHKAKEVIRNSSSGGAFTVFSDYILSLGGKVYGAVLEQDTFDVKHIGASDVIGRNRMRGSKYVQSDMGTVYKDIKEDLKRGIPVLFTGTPCQCAALCSYLKEKPENLFVVDLLCHGVPSNKLLKNHIQLWERKVDKKVANYSYRDKRYGYEYTHCIEFTDGSLNSSVNLKRLIKLYDISMRPSCNTCPYTNRNRVGDITIGDMWEAGEVVKIYDHRGTSLVVVNSEKGKQLLSKVWEEAKWIEVSKNSLTQNAFSFPTKAHEKQESFWRDYLEKDYEYVLNKYAPYTVKSWGYTTLWRVLYFTHLDVVAVYIRSKLRRNK